MLDFWIVGQNADWVIVAVNFVCTIIFTT